MFDQQRCSRVGLEVTFALQVKRRLRLDLIDRHGDETVGVGDVHGRSSVHASLGVNGAKNPVVVRAEQFPAVVRIYLHGPGSTDSGTIGSSKTHVTPRWSDARADGRSWALDVFGGGHLPVALGRRSSAVPRP